MSKRTPIALALALVVIAILAVHEAAPPRDALDPLAFRLGEGTSASYELIQSTSLVTSGDGSVLQQVTLEGRLSVRVTADGTRRLLAAQLSPVRVDVNGVRQPELEGVVASPFAVEIDGDGRLGASRFPPRLAAPDRASLDGTLRALEIVVPPGAGLTWEATERDRSGEYRASYRRTPGVAIEKRKLGYVSGRSPYPVRVLSGIARAEIDRDGPWLGTATGAETVELLSPRGAPLLTVTTTFELRPLHAPAPPHLALWGEVVAAASVGVDAPSPAGESGWEAVARTEARRRFLEAHATLGELVERLGTTAARGGAAARELASYLQAFPQEVPRVDGMLRRAGEATAAALVHALELADTPESQAVLAGVMEDPSHVRANRLRAVVAMGGVRHPSADAVARVAAAARRLGDGDVTTADVAGAALLAEGAMAPRAPEGMGAAIVADLRDAAVGEGQPGTQGLAMLALENAGESLSGAELRARLRSGDAGVREVAIRMVGAEEGPAATGELVGALSGDGSAAVRRESARALLARAPDPAANAAIISALARDGERDATVRELLVRYLGRNATTFPANVEVLQAQLARERDRSVVIAILNSLPR